MSSATGDTSHPKKTYLIIWGVLALLTAIEIYAATGLAGSAKWMALIALAVIKAGAVGWWYMHLNNERGWLHFIALLPLWAVLYTVVLIQEVQHR